MIEFGGLVPTTDIMNVYVLQNPSNMHPSPPPCMLHIYIYSIEQNRGGGLISGIVIFPHDDHYQPLNATCTWAGNLCTSKI